jgi:hypothetical protein
MKAYFVCANCHQEYLADWFVVYKRHNGSQFSIAYAEKKFCSYKCSLQYAVAHQGEQSTD